MTNKELKQLLKTLTEHGVKRFKTSEIELELDPPSHPNPAIDAALNQALNTKEEPLKSLTEEEILLWSSAGS